MMQMARVGAYVLRQRLAGVKRYPLVLMLEPLFRCNLACAGCGKIDYPDKILNQRISVADSIAAIDEAGLGTSGDMLRAAAHFVAARAS